MHERKFKPLFVATAFLIIPNLYIDLVHVSAQPVPPSPLHSSNPSARLYDDTIIVKYRETSLQAGDPSQRKAKMDDIAAGLLGQHGVTAVRTLPILGIQRFRLGPGQSLNAKILALRNNPHVAIAEYNYRIISHQSPNDPRWTSGILWGLGKINMQEAWQVAHNGKNIVVAVIDSGIDYLHPDLAPNMWMDGSMYGRNTCAGDFNPMDTVGHGTMVAGVIGAKGYNSYGSVGVNWDVKIMAVKFLCENDPNLGVPVGSLADAEEAIEYAISSKANIINASWRVIPPISASDIQTLETAVRRTNCEGDNLPAGCRPALFVAAAGNGVYFGESLNSDDNPVYPANFSISNIVAVAATDWNDNLWTNSHYGIVSVPIAAPGVNIESTTLHTVGDGFSALDGTSMAAPHVAGCAALLQAQCLRCSGSMLSIPDLKTKIFGTATNVANLNSQIQGGRRLNCGQALKQAPTCGLFNIDVNPNPTNAAPSVPTGLTVR
jgi:subtilisin family serine protease